MRPRQIRPKARTRSRRFVAASSMFARSILQRRAAALRAQRVDELVERARGEVHLRLKVADAGFCGLQPELLQLMHLFGEADLLGVELSGARAQVAAELRSAMRSRARRASPTLASADAAIERRSASVEAEARLARAALRAASSSSKSTSACARDRREETQRSRRAVRRGPPGRRRALLLAAPLSRRAPPRDGARGRCARAEARAPPRLSDGLFHLGRRALSPRARAPSPPPRAARRPRTLAGQLKPRTSRPSGADERRARGSSERLSRSGAARRRRRRPRARSGSRRGARARARAVSARVALLKRAAKLAGQRATLPSARGTMPLRQRSIGGACAGASATGPATVARRAETIGRSARLGLGTWWSARAATAASRGASTRRPRAPRARRRAARRSSASPPCAQAVEAGVGSRGGPSALGARRALVVLGRARAPRASAAFSRARKAAPRFGATMRAQRRPDEGEQARRDPLGGTRGEARPVRAWRWRVTASRPPRARCARKGGVALPHPRWAAAARNLFATSPCRRRARTIPRAGPSAQSERRAGARAAGPA